MPSPSGSAVKLQLQRVEPGAQRAGGEDVGSTGHRRRAHVRRRRGRGGQGLPLVAAVHDRGGHLADPAQPHRRADPRDAEIAMTRLLRPGSTVLGGIRVLDYGRFIAAPWCSAILADMGADVIRVEKREGGEDRWVQSVTEGGEGGTFLQCNRNKRSLTLDSTTPEGAEITRRLVAGADVVIANMPVEGHAGQRARLREPPGGQAGHHPRQRDRLRRRRPLQRQDRLRRHRPGDVRRHVPPGSARPADPHRWCPTPTSARR